MHEARLARDLIEKATQVARSENANSLSGVSVDIGALNHATPASLRALLQDAAAGTVVADTEWNITKAEDETASDALDVRLVSVRIREE